MSESRPPLADEATSSSEIVQVAQLHLLLDETGSFKICTPPSCAKQTANVLKRLSEREQELWRRRFTSSCIENILNSQTVDDETKTFYREVERKLKEQ